MKLHRTCEGDGALRVESDTLGRHEVTVFPTGLAVIRDTADGSIVALDAAQLHELVAASLDARLIDAARSPFSEVVELDPGDPAAVEAGELGHDGEPLDAAGASA